MLVRMAITEQLAIKERTRWFDPYVAGIVQRGYTPHGIIALLRGFPMKWTDDVILISNSVQENTSILVAAKYFAGSSSYPLSIIDYQNLLLSKGSRSLDRIKITVPARTINDARRYADEVFKKLAEGLQSKLPVQCPACGSYQVVDFGPYFTCGLCNKIFGNDVVRLNPFPGTITSRRYKRDQIQIVSNPFPRTVVNFSERYKRNQIRMEPKPRPVQKLKSDDGYYKIMSRDKRAQEIYRGLEASYKGFDEYDDEYDDELLRRKKSVIPKESSNKEPVIKVISHRAKRKIILKD